MLSLLCAWARHLKTRTQRRQEIGTYVRPASETPDNQKIYHLNTLHLYPAQTRKRTKKELPNSYVKLLNYRHPIDRFLQKTRVRFLQKTVETCNQVCRVLRSSGKNIKETTWQFSCKDPSVRGEYSQLFIHKLCAFLGYSNHKQFFLFTAFASITSAPLLEKSWLRLWFRLWVQI